MPKDKKNLHDTTYILLVSKIFNEIGNKYLKDVMVKIQAEESGLNSELSIIRNLKNQEKAASYAYSIKHLNDDLMAYVTYAIDKAGYFDESVKTKIVSEYAYGNAGYFNLDGLIENLSLNIEETFIIENPPGLTYFIGYIWNVTKKYIDVVSLYFSYQGDTNNGSCVFKVYDQKLFQENYTYNEKTDLNFYEQVGDFNCAGNNLSALTKSKHNTFETYFLIKTNFLQNRKQKNTINTGYYTTTLSTSDISTGLIVIERKNDAFSVEETVKQIFQDRIKEESGHILSYGKLRNFYEDSIIHPAIQSALHNRNFNTLDEQFVQNIEDLNYTQHISYVEYSSNQKFEGFYQYHYLDASNNRVVNGLIHIGISGKSYIYTDHFQLYTGFFQTVENDIANIGFDYNISKQFYRLNILISLRNQIKSPYLYGVYNSISRSNNLLFSGRIRLTKVNNSSFENIIQQYEPGYIKLNYKDLQESDDPVTKELWNFLKGKLPNDYLFGESLSFYEKLLDQQLLVSDSDFSQTTAAIISPENGSEIDRIITVKIILDEVPEDGNVWIGVMHTANNLIWPKDMLKDPQRDGEHIIIITEVGNVEPGNLVITVFGVGLAGNNMLKNWQRRSEKTGTWAGIQPKSIPGYKQLASINQLSISRTY